MELWGITDKGSIRDENQDTYEICQLSECACLAVVCDGMGGARAGNVASQLAVRYFVETIQQSTPGQAADERLKQAAAAANAAVFHRSGTDAECRGMGTTLVAAYVDEGEATLINEGDSRAYHISDGGICRITRDHSVVEDLVQRGDITAEEARSHPQKNLITRALGSESVLHADIFQKTLQKGEFLLLCTDGLSNTVSDQELLYEVLHGGDPSDCCKRLLEISLNRGAPDNLTAVLIKY